MIGSFEYVSNIEGVKLNLFLYNALVHINDLSLTVLINLTIKSFITPFGDSYFNSFIFIYI